MSPSTRRSRLPQLPPPVGAGFLLLTGLLLCSAVLLSPPLSRVTAVQDLDEFVQVAVYFLAAALVGMRVRHDAHGRLAWSLLALALFSYGAGNLYYFAVLAKMSSPAFPSLADVLWLAFAPLAYACLVLLLRAQVSRWHGSTCLDGLVVTGGLGAGAVALVFGRLFVPGTGKAAEIAVALAYPVADLLLLVLLAGAMTVLGRHADRQWWLLGAGLLAFTLGDLQYLLQSAGDGYVAGTWLDLTWLLGVAAMAAGAWASPDATPQPVQRGPLLLVVPLGFAATSLALLVWGSLRTSAPDPLATWLACATILLALLRAALTVREVQHLGEARHQARTDELTGLPNRRQFLESLTTRCQDADVPMAVFLLDLDGFKEVNDSFGHQTGDRLLQLVATRLQASLGGRGLLARMGGDEFAALLPGVQRETAVQSAHDMSLVLRDAFLLDGMEVHIDVSIGIALVTAAGDEPSDLLRRADSAMYEAKRGRLGHVVWQSGSAEEARRRLQTTEELREALRCDQLVVHYQPKLDLASGVVVGAEALVRWNHPTRGLLQPDAFLLYAERAGLMRPLTLVVLEKALRQVASWRALKPHLHVAVNLSASNLQDPSLPEQVRLLLERLAVPAGALVLEVTEDVLMTDATRAQHVLLGLRALGVRLAVDDFGTGYSSLAYLQALPVDELKLDRSFVSHLRSDPRSAAIVRSTVNLAHELGMVMTAEGVESQEVLADLTGWSCDLAQGFHIARPMDEQSFTRWLGSPAETSRRPSTSQHPAAADRPSIGV